MLIDRFWKRMKRKADRLVIGKRMKRQADGQVREEDEKAS
jgi:hypothetical protein